jgi:solute carrier family 45 protein 1/2/4
MLCSYALQITYSVPFSVTAELTAGTGGGQGSCCRYISPVIYYALVNHTD